MATKNSKNTRTKKNTSAPKRQPRRTVNEVQPAPKKAVDPEKRAKKNTLIKDIVFIVLIAFAILSYVSMFTSTMTWLSAALQFVFGWVMYVAPLVILVVAMIVMYHEKGPLFWRRMIALFLILFALSGLFSFLSSDVNNGGLLGRLNYLMFKGWLDKIGSTIVNIMLILIGIVISVDFSIIAYLREKGNKQTEKVLSKKQAYDERREEKRLERENRELMEQKNRQMTIQDYKEKNRILEDYNQRQDNRLKENEIRFKPVYGIGDTKITEDDDEENVTTFHYGDSDATSQNADMFGKYANSGLEGEKEKNDDLDEEHTNETFKINFGSSLFTQNKNDNAAQIDSDSDSTEEKKGFTDDELKESLSPSDKYEKIVITSSGKVTRIETDGGLLKNKEIIDCSKQETDDSFSAGADSNAAESVKTAQKPQKEPTKEYKFPPLRLLQKGAGSGSTKDDIKRELQENADKLQQTLRTFGIGVTVTEITCGPSVTRYEIQPEIGVKVSRITALTDDIKMNLAAKDIRIEAPIPGKSAIGIEVPNKAKTGVYIRDLLESDEFKNSKSKLSFVLGRDIEGRTIVADIAKMPHVLIAGTTGSGKSVCLNTMIMSIVYHAKPTEVKMLMVDPKMVEMQVYNALPHLLLPVITDPKKASLALQWACKEMDERYEKFAEYRVRGIEGFNDFVIANGYEDTKGNPLRPMPQIVIFVDEMSDMMMVAKKEVEDSIIRLAQKARAAGIHLVLATQSPRAEVLTGLIKANVPSRIALSVSSGMESRIILDMNGAETLLGHGDMLYLPSGANKPSRIQGAFISDKEIQDVMDYVGGQTNVIGGGVSDINLETKAEASSEGGSDKGVVDEYFESCGRYIIEVNKASIGQLQRKFSIGFNRAARIMDQLAEYEVVGPDEGTKPRRILMSMLQFDELLKSL